MKTGKWIGWVLAGIAIALLLIKWFEGSSDDLQPASEPRVEVADNTSSNCEVGINMNGEELIRLYEENAYFRAWIEVLEAQLADCQANKDGKTSIKPKIPPKRDLNKGNTSSGGAPSQKIEDSEATTSDASSRSSNPQIAINKYVGDIVGDFGITFDDKSRIFFYVKKHLVDDIKNRNTEETLLYGPGGYKHQIVGEYMIWKTADILLAEKINEPIEGAIFIGNHEQWNYEMWIPHELVKLDLKLADHPNIIRKGGGFQFKMKPNYKTK